MNLKSAKEWLDEEGYGNGEYDIKSLSVIMERYANYKTAELQATIMNFLMRLKAQLEKTDGAVEYDIYEQTLLNFDATFGITEVRNGQ